MSEFAPLEQALDAMLARLGPVQRRALAAKVASDLRKARAANIKANEQPDGSAMVPRKPKLSGSMRGKKLRDRAESSGGGLRNRRMFLRAAGPGYLRKEAGPDGAQVGFVGAMARIMRVHQEGLRDTVTRKPNSPEVQYPVRQVLGFNEADRAALLERVAEHLSR